MAIERLGDIMPALAMALDKEQLEAFARSGGRVAFGEFGLEVGPAGGRTVEQAETGHHLEGRPLRIGQRRGRRKSGE